MTVRELIKRLRKLSPEAEVVLNADRNELANGRPVGHVEEVTAVFRPVDDTYSPSAVGAFDPEDMDDYGYEERLVVNLTPN